MTDLKTLKGVGAKTEEKLNALGISSADDLLFFLPKTYLDLQEFGEVASAEEGDFVLLPVIVRSKSPLIKKQGRSIAILQGESGGEKIKLVFYNRDYILSAVKAGFSYRVYGKISRVKGLHMINPQIEEETETPKLTGILPVYPLKGLVPQGKFRAVLKDAAERLRVLSAAEAADEELPLSEAVRLAHFPDAFADAERGAKRILLEKTIRELLRYREERQREKRPRTRWYSGGGDVKSKIAKAFPFALNFSQTVAIDTIIKGLLQNKPYHGVLIGDVGSGKTAVALYLCAYAADSGYQSALMAPTELVAAQHFQNAERVFSALGFRAALLTSSIKGAKRREILAKLAAGEIDLLVGTHSVLNEEVRFQNLSFAVADEQHRFGVSARDALFSKAGGVDTLSMSATPIPRTLKLLYLEEHQAVSLSPRHETNNIKTRVVLKEKRDAMLEYLANEAENGRLCYIVSPQISDMEGIPLSGAEEIFDEFKKRFPEVPTGLLTGRMPFREKEETAAAFRLKKIRVLVATTVVEVGLDVPEADLIAVMYADRLGLASLHQLRGRVGRSGQDAYCFLYTERREEVDRLKILTQTNDGMKIAEADFSMRGSGELVGTLQHGRDRMLAGVTEELLREAKRYADTTIL